MRLHSLLSSLFVAAFAAAPLVHASESAPSAPAFEVTVDRFADVQLVRYQVPGFDALSLRQKQLAYYLYQAGLSGRDIYWDQQYPNNLLVRKTLEAVLETYSGERKGPQWDAFYTYARQVFFAYGIHHHYSHRKIMPAFTAAYLAELLQHSATARLPLDGGTVDQLTQTLTPILLDPKVDPACTNVDPGIDNIAASANHFYVGVTAAEVEAFYKDMAAKSPNPRVTFGLNSQLVKVDGKLVERKWTVGGMYGQAIERIVYWLEKALPVTENDGQRESLQHLINYYRSGDINEFDRHSIAWVKDTQSRIDVVNGFIETYTDPLGRRGDFEAIVSMRDEEATKRIAAISALAQWFEDHSPILPSHKKADVVGISAKVITVIGEVGNATTGQPIGINLPNAEWIREEYGSKSVSLGNIIESVNAYQARSPAAAEFASSPEVAARLKQWGPLAADLHVDMHEVIGHASGRINPGVPGLHESLKNYASTLEEARADLVALYYIMDPKLVEIGVMPSLEVGKAGYDKYINNGLLQQLNRIKPGDNLQEAHMRNRQLNAGWVFAKGAADKVIERVVRDGKTYFQINDYVKLRDLFGQLLREIQRIKSEGDFAAGQALVENYGVKVDQALLDEVHRRYAPLNVAPYTGAMHPKLVPVMKDGEIVDVKVENPTDFTAQCLEYGRDYGFLPLHN